MTDKNDNDFVSAINLTLFSLGCVTMGQIILPSISKEEIKESIFEKLRSLIDAQLIELFNDSQEKIKGEDIPEHLLIFLLSKLIDKVLRDISKESLKYMNFKNSLEEHFAKTIIHD
tara:strand:+ start:153 stop:500 length:348 start_codon:yes stop_codon:yes gene_type:complete